MTTIIIISHGSSGPQVEVVNNDTGVDTTQLENLILGTLTSEDTSDGNK
jgi:hypothetical protein